MERERLLSYLEVLCFPDDDTVDPAYRGKQLPVRFDAEKGTVTVDKIPLTGKTETWALRHFKQYL